MILLKAIGRMKIFLEIWKDKSGGLSAILGVASTLFSAASSLGLFGGDKKDKAPATAAVPTVLAKEPTPSEPVVRQAQDRSRRRKAAAVGRKSTILTSPLGLTGDDNIARPSLLGQ